MPPMHRSAGSKERHKSRGACAAAAPLAMHVNAPRQRMDAALSCCSALQLLSRASRARQEAVGARSGEGARSNAAVRADRAVTWCIGHPFSIAAEWAPWTQRQRQGAGGRPRSCCWPCLRLLPEPSRCGSVLGAPREGACPAGFMTAPLPLEPLLALRSPCATAPYGPPCDAQIGPRPTKPPGVIVKYKSPRGAQPAIAGARPGSGGVPSQALDPALNLYRVQVPAGQTAAQAAAALARSSGEKAPGSGGWVGGRWPDGRHMHACHDWGEHRPAQALLLLCEQRRLPLRRR